ncbi:unnamed protein product [Miscanthus lutarioriparius]|uniref:Uncharacterized protein n=1 Tax=Miscanthus lutarioriparius TaxID=422564 RepID=A0A811RCI6_9POAL|nr:unnamed protein product [Miscanthus lutarioriparius]
MAVWPKPLRQGRGGRASLLTPRTPRPSADLLSRHSTAGMSIHGEDRHAASPRRLRLPLSPIPLGTRAASTHTLALDVIVGARAALQPPAISFFLAWSSGGATAPTPGRGRQKRIPPSKGDPSDPLNSSWSPVGPSKHLNLHNGYDAVTTSVSGCADDLSYRCSSDTFDPDGRTFNISENWTVLSTEGDKPIPRFYHAAAIVSSKMVVFGGDSGQRLLDDTKILNLEKLTWDSAPPKVCPSPSGRSMKLPACKGHCLLNCYLSLGVLVPWGNSVILVGDFDTMVWSRVKTHGPHPSPRAGCSGTLCGTKWYIAGGASKKNGFSMVPFYHRDKIALIAFGGNKKEPSNKVEVLVVLQNEHSFSWRSAPEVDRVLYEYSPSNKELADHLNKCAPLYSNSSIARHSLTSVIEHPPRREPLSESLSKQSSLGTSLHGQLDQVEECSLCQKLQKPIDDDRYDDVDDDSSYCFLQPKGQRSKRTGPGIQNDIAENMVTGGSNVRRIARCSSDVSQSHLYNTKIADLIRRNTTLEDQLATALASKDQLEKSLSSVIHSREQLEKMLANKDKEAEMLKELRAGAGRVEQPLEHSAR